MSKFTQVKVTDETDNQTKLTGATATGGSQEGATLTVSSTKAVQLTEGRCYLLEGSPDLGDSATFQGSVRIVEGQGKVKVLYPFTVDNSHCQGLRKGAGGSEPKIPGRG